MRRWEIMTIDFELEGEGELVQLLQEATRSLIAHVKQTA